MSTPRGTTQIAQLVNGLLENGYQSAAGQVIQAISAEMSTGIIAQRLAELDAEAQRLAQAGQALEPDNPVLRALLADLEAAQYQNQLRIQAAAPRLTEAGVNASNQIQQQLVFAGMSDNARNTISQQWNRPDPQAVAALVDFTNDPAFEEMMIAYGANTLERIRLRATYGFVNGWGARRVATSIRQLSTNLPRAEAETITRTLHLVSYRRGTAATQAANAHILQADAIRIAVLDARTCLTCVALHGTKIPAGKPVADHWQGRCISIAQVRGFNRNITPGVQWFNSLPRERQMQQRAFVQSPAAWAAYEDGAVTLDDFVSESYDPIFGDMVNQASLRGILGDAARQYYRR